MNKQNKVFAPSKVAVEKHKIEAYLNGEHIFPTTVKLDQLNSVHVPVRGALTLYQGNKALHCNFLFWTEYSAYWVFIHRVLCYPEENRQ